MRWPWQHDDEPAPGTSVAAASDPSKIPADGKDGLHVACATEADRATEGA